MFSKKHINIVLKVFTALFFGLITINAALALTPPTGGVSYYNFSSVTDLWGSNDATNNGATSVLSFPSFNINNNSSPNSFDFDGINDNVQIPSLLNNPSEYSFSIWVKSDTPTVAGNGAVLYYADSTSGILTFVNIDESINNRIVAASRQSGSTISIDGIAADVTDWTHIVITAKENDFFNLYINGVLADSSAITTFDDVAQVGRGFGSAKPGGSSFDFFPGLIDEVKIFNRSINETEVQNIYNYGTIEPSPTPSPLNVTHYLEGVSVVRQTTNVTINSVSYVTVVNGSFSLDNASDVYAAFTINALGIINQELFCRVLIDGVDYDSVVDRSFTAINQRGSLYAVSSPASLSSGSHSLALQCRRDNSPITVFDSLGLVHVLSNSDGDEINHINSSFASSLSSISYSLLDSFSFTSSDVPTNLSRVAVLNSRVLADYVSASNFDFYASLNSQNTSVISRYGGAGSDGSAALIGVFDGLAENTTYNLSFYGRSSSSNGLLNVSFVLKEFFLNDTEVNSSVFGGSGVVSTSWTNISTIKLDNFEHAFSDVVLKAVVSGSSSASSTLDFRFLVNGEVYGDSSRSFNTNKGVLIIQDALQNVAFGNYSVYLQARTTTGSITFSRNGTLLAYVAQDVDFSDISYLVNASNTYTGEKIFSFNVTDELGTVFQSNASGVALVVPYQAFEDLDVSSSGFITKTYINHDVLTDLEAFLVPNFFFDTVFFNNYTEFSGFNYSRVLGYRVQYSCVTGSLGSVFLFENDSLGDSFSPVCNGNLINSSGSYEASSEGLKNISFNWSFNSEDFSGQLFVFDLVDPVVSSNWLTTRGFNSNNISGWFACSDSISPVASLLSYWNSGLFFNDSAISLPANESFSNSSVNGVNTLLTSCEDLVGGLTIFNDSQVVFSPSFLLVDEQNGDSFDVSNLSSVVVYVDDNSTFIDLKSLATNTFNFTTTEGEVLRFEYIYSDGFILNRYVDVSLTNEQDLRICVPRDDNFQFYEKIFISSSSGSDFELRGLFAECIALLDYTRFAYQDSYSIRTFTIDTTYRLSTIDSDGDLVFLASIDGGIEAFINLDTLEFSRSQVPVSIQPETLSVQKVFNTTLLFVYNNSGASNQDLFFEIIRTDTGATVYSENSFPDPDAFVLFWDFSSLGDVSGVLFKAVVTKSDVDGSESTKSIFFTTDGRSGLINPKVAFAISFLLLLFGFSFSTANVSLSWLGFFICLGVLAILSASIWTPAILLLGAIDLFIMIYIVILMNMQTSRGVVT